MSNEQLEHKIIELQIVIQMLIEKFPEGTFSEEELEDIRKMLLPYVN